MSEEIKTKEFKSVLEKAKNDDRIIGLILTGGRGKGVFTENSDYDVMFITTDEGFEDVKRDYPKTEHIDSLPHAISKFREHAEIGTQTEYDKYTFTHNVALIDKTREIQKLIDKKGILQKEQMFSVAKNALGGYLNSLYRSIKNHRDGNIFASHFDACESLPWLFTFLFAIEGRVRPYNKFLKWELEKYPLKNLSISSVNFLEKTELVIKSGDIKAQKEIHKIVEKIAINDCSDVIDDWKGYYFG